MIGMFITTRETIRPHMPVLALTVVCLIAINDLACCLSTTFESFVVYGVFSGILSAVYFLCRTLCLQDLMGRDDLPSVYGIFNFLVGVGSVIVPVITGALVDFFGTNRIPFLFFAVSQVLTFFALSASILIKKRKLSS